MLNKAIRHTFLAVAVMGAASLTGCASIVSGTNQVVSVETLYSGSAMAGATCELNNEKGVYYVTTPGTVTVNRAYGDMHVRCERPGFQPGVARVKSFTKNMMAGNILFGGPLGAGVDAATGAGYDYPPVLRVRMGQKIPLSAAPAAASAIAAPVVVDPVAVQLLVR